MGGYFSSQDIQGLTPDQHKVLSGEIEALRRHTHQAAERQNRLDVARIRASAIRNASETERKQTLRDYRGKLAEYKAALRGLLEQGGFPKLDPETGQVTGITPVDSRLVSEYLGMIENLDKRAITGKWDENDEEAFLGLDDFYSWYEQQMRSAPTGAMHYEPPNPLRAFEEENAGILSKLRMPSRRQAIRIVRGQPEPKKKPADDPFGIMDLLAQ